jgi:hypothetical protein
LIHEIEEITDVDEKIRSQLTRKEKTLNMVRNNKSIMEKSLNNLEDFLNRSGNRNFNSSI